MMEEKGMLLYVGSLGPFHVYVGSLPCLCWVPTMFMLGPHYVYVGSLSRSCWVLVMFMLVPYHIYFGCPQIYFGQLIFFRPDNPTPPITVSANCFYKLLDITSFAWFSQIDKKQ